MTFLKWESEFFGIKIFDLHINSVDLVDSITRRLSIELERTSFDCVQAKVKLKDTAIINLLEALSFRMVDIHVNLMKSLVNLSPNINNDSFSVRFAESRDISKIRNVLNDNFQHSRFFKMGVGSEMINNFYCLWAEKSIVGNFDDFCLVVEYVGEIVGIVTVKYIDENARIGLLAVSKEVWGKNASHHLVSYLTEHLNTKKVKNIIVNTEATNLRALNFYLKIGFKITDCVAILYRQKLINR